MGCAWSGAEAAGLARERTRRSLGCPLWCVGHGLEGKLLAQRHALSRPAVYRIFEKYGIVRGEHGLVEMEPLKIFLDPLFGVTVSGIAGLYYGTCGVLALSSAVRPFSELDLVANTTSLSQAATVLLDELHKLAELRYAKFMDIAALKVLEGNAFLGWLNRIEDRRESNAEIHLLADLPQWEPQALPSFQEWLTHHTNFKMHYAPIVKHLFWFHLVQRVFSIVAALPVQAQLVADVNGLAKYLANIPDKDRLGIIIVMHLSQNDLH